MFDFLQSFRSDGVLSDLTRYFVGRGAMEKIRLIVLLCQRCNAVNVALVGGDVQRGPVLLAAQLVEVEFAGGLELVVFL